MTDLERIASALQADLHNNGLMIGPKNHIPQAADRILAALKEAVAAERERCAKIGEGAVLLLAKKLASERGEQT